MACINYVAPQPLNGGGSFFYPTAINQAHTSIYGIAGSNVERFTWPGLAYDSTYSTLSGSGLDVTVDAAGNVYTASMSGTTCTVRKNGSTLTTITVAANASGGGISIAAGYLWTTVSTDSGSDSGSLYRIDTSTGTTTVAHSISGGQLTSKPYPATDGALWYGSQAGGTVYRHLAGSTTSVAVNVQNHFIARPGGVMLTRRTSPTGWIDISPALAIGAPACDPTIATGAPAGVMLAFSSPDRSDVGFISTAGFIYRADYVAPPVTARWRVGRIGWPT